MYTISYLVNGSWVDVTTTDSRPTKALFLLRYNASLIEGCTLCGVFDSKTRELMCYVAPAARS